MALSEREKSWWRRDDVDEEDPQAFARLHAVITQIERVQDYRKRAHLLHAAIYGDVSMYMGMGAGQMRTTPGNTINSNLSLNVSRNATDAVVSRIASKSKPHLSYVTEGGDYEKQHNAEQLERGVEGGFYRTSAYDYFVAGFRDACVFGTGRTRIDDDQFERQVIVKRYLPWQAFHDDGEVMYGDPRSLYCVTYEDKWVLLHRYAEDEYKASQIEKLQGDRDDDADSSYQTVLTRLRMEEAWHLPSGRGATDGRHVIGLSNVTLVDEPWEPPSYDLLWPFCEVTWSPNIVMTQATGGGGFGQGLIELGSGIQADINKMVRAIQRGLHLITGHWLVDQNSKVISSHINNDLGAIVKYQGQAPIYQVPSVIAPETYQHLATQYGRYYELAGINQQTAQAQKPVGLSSGEAQRVYADQQTETLLEKGQRYEQYVRKGGALFSAAAKRIAKKHPYEVRAFADDVFQTIDWRTLDEPDGYMLRVSPTSSLPGTPAGKIDLAYDLLKIGDFDSSDLLEIIGMPDITRATAMKLASRKLVEKKVGEMLRLGTPYEPHSLLNLDEAIVVARDACNVAEARGVDDDLLQVVRDFIVACTTLKTKQQAPAPQAIGPGGTLMAPGAPPPIAPMAAGRPPPPGAAPPPPAQAA